MTQDCFCFANAQIVFPDEIRSEALYVKGGKIVPAQTPNVIIECGGSFIAPGLIDLQVNGVEGIDFTTDPEGINRACSILPRYGVTSFLATLLRPPLGPIPELHPVCVGVHLEGPYLNPQYAGAHDRSSLESPCRISNLPEMLGQLKMMTLAPELERAQELISWLSKNNVVACCGHSGASCDVLEEASKNGLQMVTHLYNAMAPLHTRAPGIIGYTLAKRALYYSVIADGVHVAPEVLLVAYNAHPDGLILVSDCNALLGASKGTLAGQPIEKSGHSAHLVGTQQLAGSCISLFDCVKNFARICGSLPKAIACASQRPAELLGSLKKKGTLDIGFDADFIIFSDTFKLQATYCEGVCAFRDSDSL